MKNVPLDQLLILKNLIETKGTRLQTCLAATLWLNSPGPVSIGSFTWVKILKELLKGKIIHFPTKWQAITDHYTELWGARAPNYQEGHLFLKSDTQGLKLIRLPTVLRSQSTEISLHSLKKVLRTKLSRRHFQWMLNHEWSQKSLRILSLSEVGKTNQIKSVCKKQYH